MFSVMVRWFAIPLIGATLVGGCSEGLVVTSTNRYATYREASDDGAFERGWLPRDLPDSAHGITESHNIDTNELLISFQFDQVGMNAFLGRCAKDPALRLPSAVRAQRLAAWWPEALTDKGSEHLHDTMQKYRCSRMRHAKSEIEAGMVLDARARTSWYWRVR